MKNQNRKFVEIAPEPPKESKKNSPLSVPIFIRVSQEDRQAIDQASALSGKRITTWIREQLRQAANNAIKGDAWRIT